MPGSSDSGSMLRVGELFDAEDPDFLPALRDVRFKHKAIAGFADRWVRDPRPWAKAQLLEYFEPPLCIPGHEPIPKRALRHAERVEDDRLMASLLVACDRLVRHSREKRWKYDWETRSGETYEVLVVHRNRVPLNPTRTEQTWRGGTYEVPVRIPRGARHFSYHTRYYLRRRTWRYFRQLGYRDPQRYLHAALAALALYRNEDLDAGEHILDSWGLMHLCFGKHPGVEFGTSKVSLKPGVSLADLTADPCFSELWKSTDAGPLLLDLLVNCQASLVATWCQQMLNRFHAPLLDTLPIAQLRQLLEHELELVKQFASTLLERSQLLAEAPLEVWFELLETNQPLTLAAICDAFRKHVKLEDLSFDNALELTIRQPTPVARIGFEALQLYESLDEQQRAKLDLLAQAKCAAIGSDLAAWALNFLSGENYHVDPVSAFFDSPNRQVRAGAWNWLNSRPDEAYDDAVLWARMFETPYDDVRLELVAALQQRTELIAAGEPALADFTHLWSSVLLGVFRGGRQKAKAVQQVAAALDTYPECLDQLLPVMAVAIRSIRGPEQRAGLAAVAALVERQPELRARVEEHLPELEWVPIAP